MKLTYRIIIPLVVIVFVLFTALMFFFFNSEKRIIAEAGERNSLKIIEQFEKDKKNRLEEEKRNIEFLTKTISRVSSKYVYDFDIESIGQTLNNFLEVSSIKAIEIYENSTKDFFAVAFKDGEKIVHEIKENPPYKNRFKTIKEDMHWDIDGSHIGHVTVYYDDSQIINEFKKSKETLFEKLEQSNKKQEEDISEAIFSQVLFLIFIAIVLFSMVFYMTYKRVLKPLKTLNSGLHDFFLFLQNKKDRAQKIEIKTNDEFGSMAKDLNENILVSAKLHEEIYELNTNLEEKIEEKTKKVSSLLDNADQGFLSFSEDLIIDSEYSIECRNIFKKDISGLRIGELLYPNEEDKKQFFEETLLSLLGESNKLKIKNIISLLQSEFRINKKAIHVKYKIIEDNRYMLIFTDITAKKILERNVNKEKDTLKMIVAVISDSDEFFELIEEFENFSKKKKTFINEKLTALHNTTLLYRIIHTFKGLFSQKEMKFLVKNLHNFETELSKLLTSQNNTNENLIKLIEDIDFNSWLEKELEVIKSILGEELFDKKGKIVVKEETISKIEDELSQIASKNGLSSEYEQVLDNIKSLKDKPVYTMFNSYIKLVSQLSSQLGKSIYPLDIIVNKELLVKENLKPFIKSLVHVFRNSVDHGIETMDERYANSKDEIGTITCSISQDDKNLSIIIADDGRGIDIQEVKEKAEQLEIDTSKMDNKEILNLIFEDKLSTSKNISDISGRGVGMSAVKYELDKLNGSVNITTLHNKGTSFEFIIPR